MCVCVCVCVCVVCVCARACVCTNVDHACGRKTGYDFYMRCWREETVAAWYAYYWTSRVHVWNRMQHGARFMCLCSVFLLNCTRGWRSTSGNGCLIMCAFHFICMHAGVFPTLMLQCLCVCECVWARASLEEKRMSCVCECLCVCVCVKVNVHFPLCELPLVCLRGKCERGSVRSPVETIFHSTCVSMGGTDSRSNYFIRQISEMELVQPNH